MIERGFVYRGQKPVYWCFDCGSSLAEFEIEYADKKSTTLDVGFLADDPAAQWVIRRQIAFVREAQEKRLRSAERKLGQLGRVNPLALGRAAWQNLSGGRVLSVVGTGPDLVAARERAYAVVDPIELPGGHHRTDIAQRAAEGSIEIPAD